MNPLRCALCGAPITPPGPIERCPETFNGVHVNALAYGTLSPWERQERITGPSTAKAYQQGVLFPKEEGR